MKSDEIKKMLSSSGIKFIEKRIMVYKGGGNRVTIPKEWGEGDVLIIKPDMDRGIIDLMSDLMDELDDIKAACSRMRERFSDFNFDCIGGDSINIDMEQCKKCPYGVSLMKLKMKFADLSTRFSEEEMDKRILREFDKIRDAPIINGR